MAENKKKGKRKLKKQVRRTIAGLFMASAIAVAAIPVDPINAETSDGSSDVTETLDIKTIDEVVASDETWVRCLNYDGSSWDTAPGSSPAVSPEQWKSSIPYVDSSETIYTTSTSSDNTNQYRFAYVPSSEGSSTYVAVILGAIVNDSDLTIPDKVSGFKKYSSNTTGTNYCAVSRNGRFLYYPTQTQRTVNLVKYWKLSNPSEYTPLQLDPEYSDLSEDYSNKGHKGTVQVAPGSDDAPTSMKDKYDYNYVEEYVIQDGDDYYLSVDSTTYVANKYDDAEGNPVFYWEEQNNTYKYLLKPSTVDGFEACYDSTESTWGQYDDKALYYYNKDSDGSKPEDQSNVEDFTAVGTDENRLRIHDVEVWYIGRQHVTEVDGEWQIDSVVDKTNPTQGIFANNTSITNLTLPSTIRGIGDFAFYQTSIQSVTFPNGNIKTIGNFAFANCKSLSSVSIPVDSALQILGKGAFAADKTLGSFDVPASITAIGDYCFQGCSSLASVDLTSGRNFNYLEAIGYHAFEGCISLTGIEFPNEFYQQSTALPSALNGKVPIDTFYGCVRMNYIRMNNDAHDDSQLDIVDEFDPDVYVEPDTHTSCDITTFINTLYDPNSFYFEGSNSPTSEIYKTAKVHSATFKHLGEELYERFMKCDETEGHLNTFIVNVVTDSDSGTKYGQIERVILDPECEELTVPSKVGNVTVTELTGTSFSTNVNNCDDDDTDIFKIDNLCHIKKIHIPFEITKIDTGAFKGCHALEAVIFEPDSSGAYNYQLTIDSNAFPTQVLDSTNCGHASDISGTVPVLSFTGPISSGTTLFPAYAYATALDSNGNIVNKVNNSSQTTTPITYYTDFPTMLEVQLRRDYLDTAKDSSSTPVYYASLVDYPSWDDLKDIMDGHFDLDKYPYLTDADIASLQSAYKKYSSDDTMTDSEQAIVNAALHPDIPYGVNALYDGVFSGVDADGNSNTDKTGYTVDENIKSISTHSISTLDPYTFKGCTSLEEADIDGTNTIGDYCFWNDTSLKNVTIDADDVSKIGTRPFRNCEGVLSVNFTTTTGSPNFCCDEAIIYGLNNGTKYSIVECLESRGAYLSDTKSHNGDSAVNGSETTGIQSIAEEAFMNCDHVSSVDLTDSTITVLPERTFAGTTGLESVYLPESLTNIKKDAFVDSAVTSVTIPSAFTNIDDQNCFAFTEKGHFGSKDVEDTYDGYEDDTDNPYIDAETIAEERSKPVTIYCPEQSSANSYASSETLPYINPSKYAITYEVRFWDDYADDPSVPIYTETVADGDCAEAPDESLTKHDGMTFSKWYPDVATTHITSTSAKDFYAKYDTADVTVTFYVALDDLTVVGTPQTIPYGTNAVPPAAPDRDGYNFVDWSDGWTNVTKDTAIYGIWENADATGPLVRFINWDGDVVKEYHETVGNFATPPTTNPTRTNYKFDHWNPDPATTVITEKGQDFYATFTYTGKSGSGSSSSGNSSSGSSSSKSSSSSSNSAKTYTVTVINGSGSGTYAEDSTVIITANDPATGKVFKNWTTSDATLASSTLSATTFKMPGKNVTVTANYTDGTSSSTSVKSATGNSARPVSTGATATGSTATGDTSVIVAKGGVSNVDVASATVHGSTDSFVVKVTESNEATTSVENALNNRYGSLDGLEYWACDISLYDSTGNTKITDTSGLTVDITLPIPDELQQYGGNNKAGAVANNQLEDLGTKFNTINGTPTVTFTATHFSPYVIYADTNNLDAAQMLDASPKTGDPIHPKWFLAIGLAAASVFLFFKKDRRKVQPAAV